MPDLNDYHAYKSTSGGGGSPGRGKGFGCGGWTVTEWLPIRAVYSPTRKAALSIFTILIRSPPMSIADWKA